MSPRLTRGALLAAAAALSLNGQQSFEPLKLGPLTFTGSIRTRVENWSWFPADRGDHTYTYDGSTLRFGFSQVLPRFDWMVELEAPLLLNLPSNAIAPGAQGQLGQGAGYYAANGNRSNAAMLFPKQAFVRWKLPGSSTASLRAGRFEFQDGSEVVSKDPTLASLKRDRIQQRLIGPFGFTHVMRSFDGFHFVSNRQKVNVTLIGATPTRGVFQTDGWGWLKVAFAYAAVTGSVKTKSASGEWRLFGIYYQDWRRIAKADNRAAAQRSADLANLRIGSLGAHYVHVARTGAGAADFIGEFALEGGRWGRLDHRAGMFNLEAGFQPAIWPRLKPWIRGGYYYGSGDKDPADNRHGTFFQFLPTARPYAQFPFYNMMNNVDRFGMLALRPHPRLAIRSEVHLLRLASRGDLWYLGGGVFQPWTFGYQARSAGGALGLANLVSAGAEVTVNPHFTLSPYYGRASGKSAVQAIYPRGRDGHFAFVELSYRF